MKILEPPPNLVLEIRGAVKEIRHITTVQTRAWGDGYERTEEGYACREKRTSLPIRVKYSLETKNVTLYFQDEEVHTTVLSHAGNINLVLLSSRVRTNLLDKNQLSNDESIRSVTRDYTINHFDLKGIVETALQMSPPSLL